MKHALITVALALSALSAHAAAGNACSAARFTVTNTKHATDEFKRLLVSADVRNDNDAECSALVQLLVKDKSGRELVTQKLLVGGARPLGRPLMVGETRKVSLMVPTQLVQLAKGFEMSVIDARADK